MKILITGGAGFVGSNLAILSREKWRGAEITVLDNLRRRGSELNLERFKKLGIQFVHGDIRHPSDFEGLPNVDLLIDASAEPSVLAGATGSPSYVLDTNLNGTLHCAEWARHHAGALLFLSTSRVYSIEPLRSLKTDSSASRLSVRDEQAVPGVSSRGIREDFPVSSARSFYGSTKLASEYFLQEYAFNYGLKTIINRCGVIAGAGQFGKVDQGVFTLWVAYHHFGKPLKYTGFGGQGHQVRDLLHPRDLFALISRQLETVDQWNGNIFNVGGGLEGSVSMKELTDLCTNTVGRTIPIASDPATHAVDIPWYVTDSSLVKKKYGWTPQMMPKDIVQDIAEWMKRDEVLLRPIFA